MGERPSALAVHPIAPRDLRRGGWIHRKIARHYVARTLVAGDQYPVCTENLNPDVMVMKSAKDRV